MMELERCLDECGEKNPEDVRMGINRRHQYEFYMQFSSTMYFISTDPHLLLVCLRGLGFVFRVASLHLAISNKKGPF